MKESFNCYTTVWQLLAGSTNMQIVWFVCLCEWRNYCWGKLLMILMRDSKQLIFRVCCSDWLTGRVAGDTLIPIAPGIDLSFLPSVYNRRAGLFSGSLLTKYGSWKKKKKINRKRTCTWVVFLFSILISPVHTRKSISCSERWGVIYRSV